MKWGIRTGILIILVSLVTSLLISYQSLRDLDAKGRFGSHDHEMTSEIEEVLSALKDAESGPRGFVLTGKESYLRYYWAAVPQIELHLQRLSKLTANDPPQHAELTELKRVIAEKLSFMNEVTEARREKGLDAALKMMQTDRGEQTMTTARRLIASMREKENHNQEFRVVIQSILSTFSLATVLICGLILWRRA